MSTNNPSLETINSNNLFFQEFLQKMEEGNNLQRKLLATQQEILCAVKENNDLQVQVLERLSKSKKEKRKVSSDLTIMNADDQFDDSVSTNSNSTTISHSTTTERERKKSKKNVQCSEDEICIIYEGSSNHSLIIRKELLKGPVLRAAISGNFLEESNFILPSDSIKLSNIPKAMKQLKKFFHDEKLDKCNEETKKDLQNLADFLVLPELKLELLKYQICDIPILKTNKKKGEHKNYSQVLEKIEEISTQLPGILIDLESDGMLSVLESFHEFLKSDEKRAETFASVCEIVWDKKYANRGILSIILKGCKSLDALKYYLLEECATNKDLYNIDEEKVQLLSKSISEKWQHLLPTIHESFLKDSFI
ncbi:predicted protein [Naegleria gruberi]|uniref:Predicted protein n=1 Tax=Naegleria gruberi TaxID=5762 RepID=D2VPV2_NAEGR|nr:uncharacterized protein NAEGRDRAFT_70997 [Naegleria gruberi]EFC41191.1 predicted protein [Naegleria gruberi]|eukprot:XP_002673935.1 predicted protein [Naegleria gruberi strain NEG-M]